MLVKEVDLMEAENVEFPRKGPLILKESGVFL